MCYINDARYLGGDKTTDMVKRSHSSQISVSFVQTLFPGNRSDLKLSEVVSIKALESVGREKELYASYGSGYTFPNITSISESQ